jgi:hypothetical protein
MRNDARPIGPDASDQSPFDAHQSPAEAGEGTGCEDQRVDPSMPTDDLTVNNKIETVDLEGREL